MTDVTSAEYLELAGHYERAAEKTSRGPARIQLQTIANTYLTLAQSTDVLRRSAETMGRLPRRWKP